MPQGSCCVRLKSHVSTSHASPLLGGVQTADDVYNHLTDKQLGQHTGGWYIGGHTNPEPPVAQDPAARQRLWKLMQQQTGASYNE